MKKRKSKSLGSLDSLLDTMTSVVGILLIMLIVIQLDVTNAVQRIISEEEQMERGVTDAQLAAAQKENTKLAAAQKELQKKLAAAREDRTSGSVEAQALNREIQTLQSQISAKEKQAAAAAEKAAAARQLSSEAAKKQAEIKKLQAEITAIMTDLNDAKSTLSATPIPIALPAKVVRLPAPKKAPEGAKPLYIICRAGLVAPVDTQGLTKTVKEAITKAGIKPNNDKEYDGKKIEALFRSRYVGDKDWRLKAVEANHRMRFHLYRQARAGENFKEIQSKVSRYRLLLSRINRKDRYLTFVVWPDSYDTYLMARSIASHHGFAAGWSPQAGKEGWAPWMGTYYTYGHKKTVKPPGPAKPAGPPKPVDVVD